MTQPVPAGRDRHFLLSALGITQILAWGSSFYLPAVLAQPIAADTGWTLSWVVGGLSIGLLTSALTSTFTGHLIQHHGGRPVLVAGALLMALGQVTMAMAAILPVYLLGWIIMGLGMSAGLYDAGFATLGRIYGRSARPSITTLTLWAGFASTLCWPLSAFLVEHVGWRMTSLTYAGIQLLVSVPLFLAFVPNPPTPATTSSAQASGRLGQANRLTFVLLAAIISTAAFISTVISVHLLPLLQLRGIDLATAVALGTLIGPSQFAARFLEMLVGRKHHPIWLMLASVLLLAFGTGLLFSGWPVMALALLLYGAGNGIHTIARGALPLVLFDPDRYAVVMGKLAPPSLVVQALAPSIAALLIQHGGAAVTIEALFAAAVVNVALTGALLSKDLRNGTSSKYYCETIIKKTNLYEQGQ